MDEARPISAQELSQLLQNAELEAALAIVGDAARRNLLGAEECAAVIDNREIDQYPKAAWTKGEVHLRCLADRLLAETNAEVRLELVNLLLHQKRYWPLESVLARLTEAERAYCEQALADRSVLTRATREEARQEIRRIRGRIKSQSRPL